MNVLDASDIDHLARLARLSLTKEEREKYAAQLSVVFEYMSSLNEVNTDGIEETTQVTGLLNIYREDEVCPIDTAAREKFLALFPERVGAMLKVRPVFDAE